MIQAGDHVVLVQVVDLFFQFRCIGGGSNQYFGAGFTVIAGF